MRYAATLLLLAGAACGQHNFGGSYSRNAGDTGRFSGGSGRFSGGSGQFSRGSGQFSGGSGQFSGGSGQFSGGAGRFAGGAGRSTGGTGRGGGIQTLQSVPLPPAGYVSPSLLREQSEPPKPFSYKYEGPDPYGGYSSHESHGDEQGRITGQYTVQNPDGTSRVVKYVADPQYGFHAEVDTDEEGTKTSEPSNAVIRSSAPEEGYNPQTKKGDYGASSGAGGAYSRTSKPYNTGGAGYRAASTAYKRPAAAPAYRAPGAYKPASAPFGAAGTHRSTSNFGSTGAYNAGASYKAPGAYNAAASYKASQGAYSAPVTSRGAYRASNVASGAYRARAPAPSAYRAPGTASGAYQTNYNAPAPFASASAYRGPASYKAPSSSLYGASNAPYQAAAASYRAPSAYKASPASFGQYTAGKQYGTKPYY